MQKNQNNNEAQWTILKILEWTTSYFLKHEVEGPRASAEILLAHSLGINRIDLYIRYAQPLNHSELNQFKSLIARRVQREPVAYITGKKEFWSIDLTVTNDVLIPRPETEILVETAISYLDNEPGTQPRKVLEMGTGSGAIILALASERPEHVYYASDRSKAALKVAQENAYSQNSDHELYFFCSDWFHSIAAQCEPFDLILSNPPYIPSRVIPELQDEIYMYEPIDALDGGESGTDALTQIIKSAKPFLKPGGSLLLEIGHDQKKAVKEIADQTGFYGNIVFFKDYSGTDRVAWLKLKSGRL